MLGRLFQYTETDTGLSLQAVLREVEDTICSAPQTPLSHLHSALASWKIELAALADVVTRLNSDQVRGARLLDQFEGPAVPLVQAALSRYGRPCAERL